MSFASSTAGTWQYAEATIESTLVVEGDDDCTPSYKLEVEYTADNWVLLSEWLDAVGTIFSSVSSTPSTAVFEFDVLTADLYYKISDHDMGILV
jgi:hypothetical protein